MMGKINELAIMHITNTSNTCNFIITAGQIMTIPFDISEVDVRSYQYHRARREAFSRWLASAASQNIKKEVQDIKFKVKHL